MDDARFAEARKAYDSGDFRTAAKEFLAAAGVGREGNGATYHMAGNSLTRLRRYSDAITAYDHALEDELYGKRGAVQANRGAAQAALGEYAEAIRSYEAALEDSGYATGYKALQGMAGALVEIGRTEGAPSAYRRATLDAANPNPGAALVNLGLCFMALGRPADAVEAYQAALGFDEYAGRGKALANLGQAYAALGRHDEAVRAFDKAVNLHGHALSPSAASAFQESLIATQPDHDLVEGWRTGEMQPAAPVGTDSPGWDTGGLAALGGGVGDVSADALDEAPEHGPRGPRRLPDGPPTPSFAPEPVETEGSPALFSTDRSIP